MFKKLSLILGLLMLFILMPILSGFALGEENNKNVSSTNISVYNTYGVEVELESKCDFDYKIQNYKFYRRIVIPKRSNRVIVIPYGLKNCEVWVLNVKIW